MKKEITYETYDLAERIEVSEYWVFVVYKTRTEIYPAMQVKQVMDMRMPDADFGACVRLVDGETIYAKVYCNYL